VVKCRAIDALSLECENGLTTLCGLYAWNGFVVFLIRHYQAKSSTNREFHVVRFLPGKLGHVMYKYLVFIRRFFAFSRTAPDAV
jgi:hypothetical protein